MRHTVITVLLTLGVVLGLASGIASQRFRHSHHERFEAHLADVCVRAAERARSEEP